MRTVAPPLSAFEPRMLSLLAGAVRGRRCDVQLVDDLRAPANVVGRDERLLFDAYRATLGHLLVAARLLRRRDEIEAIGGRLPTPTLRSWCRTAAKELLCEFPAIPRRLGVLPGRGFRVSWNDVRLRPRMGDTGGRPRQVLAGEDLEVKGGSGTLAAVVRAARQGLLKEHPMPDFPELRVVYETVQLAASMPTERDAEQLRQWYESAEEVVRYGVRCYRDSAQTVRQEPSGIHEMGPGGILDAAYLHDAFVAARAGYQAPEALAPEEERVRQFDPEKFVVVLAFDMAGLPNYGMLQPSPSDGMLAAFARVFQELGAAVRIVGYWDHLVGGRPGLYVSRETIVKDFAEPFDDSAALRVMQALKFEGRESERSACFPAFHCERIREGMLGEIERRGGECQAQVYYFGSRLVPYAGEERRRMDERVAAHADAVMGELEAEVGADVDGLSLVSEQALRASRHRGWLQRTQWGNEQLK